MSKISYKSMNIGPDRMKVIINALTVIREFSGRGIALTLRSLYYRMFARNMFPASWADPKTKSANNIRSYKNLGEAINDGRLTGLIDWNALEDGTRTLTRTPRWDDPADAIKAIADQYSINKWEGQENQVEVWVEKNTLEAVVDRVCRKLQVPYFSCHGYTSQTAMWNNAQRYKEMAEEGTTPCILHIGDHDPSGLDMSRDVETRTRMFMGDYGEELNFKRIALNMDQIEEHNPPPNPAKLTDCRVKEYTAKYGRESWEVEAVDPDIVIQLIEDNVADLRDNDLYQEREELEKEGRELMLKTSRRWDKVVQYLNKLK